MQIHTGPQIGVGRAVYITFTNLSIGSTYQIQILTDLNNRTNYSAPFTAATTGFNYSNYWRVADWNKLFFRLHWVLWSAADLIYCVFVFLMFEK